MNDKPKSSGQLTKLKRKKPSTVKVAVKEWKETLEDQKRSTTILVDISFDILLADIIEGNFPQRTKDVQKLMNGINMIQKARLLYILGFIDKMVLKDLEQIHEIRNKFGHSFEASFAFTKVLKFVRKLSTAKAHEVTPENSYKFYHNAGTKCQNYLIAIYEKQKLKEQ